MYFKLSRTNGYWKVEWSYTGECYETKIFYDLDEATRFMKRMVRS